MPLEDLVGPNKFISDLVREWPLGIDPIAEGDDHIRGLKNTLRNSFPTVGQARYPVTHILPPAGESEEKAGALEVAAGTTAQRPATPAVGYTRYNTDLQLLETYNGSGWAPVIVGNLNPTIERSDATTVTINAKTTNQWPINLHYFANNSAAVLKRYAAQFVRIRDAAEGAETGEHYFNTMRAGVDKQQMVIGDGMILPSADNQYPDYMGQGTFNAGNGVYRDGIEYTRGWTKFPRRTVDGTEDFTPIPEGVNEIVVSFQGVSNTGTMYVRARVGGAAVSTGYAGSAHEADGGSGNSQSYTAGFPINARGNSVVGQYILYRTGDDNRWTASHSMGQSGSGRRVYDGGGYISLSGPLDGIRVSNAIGGYLGVMYR